MGPFPRVTSLRPCGGLGHTEACRRRSPGTGTGSSPAETPHRASTAWTHTSHSAVQLAAGGTVGGLEPQSWILPDVGQADTRRCPLLCQPPLRRQRPLPSDRGVSSTLGFQSPRELTFSRSLSEAKRFFSSSSSSCLLCSSLWVFSRCFLCAR